MAAMAQNDLILALFEGLLGEAPWDSFLKGLLARTAGDRIHLLSPGGNHRIARRDGGDAVAAMRELAALDRVLALLRPGRIYALDELRDFDSKEARASQDAALAAAQIGDARIVRLGSGKASVWVLLLAERAQFSAADSALVSGLVPAIEIALGQLATLRTWRRRAQAAEGSLALLGIGQAVLDEAGNTLAADPLWQAERTALQDGRPLVLRPEPAGSNTVASFRLPPRALPAAAAPIIAQTLGLSKREAALAALLSQGHALVEAGRLLNLTEETTRSYSKRIYAKTGAKGQGDLVRLVLTGLAPLAEESPRTSGL